MNIVDIGGKGTFAKCTELPDAYEIACVILADRDDDWAKLLENETGEFPSDCRSRIGTSIVLTKILSVC